MEHDEAYHEAKKRLQLKLGFRIHLIVYVGVILLLLFIDLSKSGDGIWVIWPALGWGIGLIVHGLNAYSFKGRKAISDEMIRKEMDRVNRE